MIKLELIRFIKSNKLFYYILSVCALIITNYILQINLDHNINDSQIAFNLFQTFNMFYFLISSFIFGTIFSDDVEKKYEIFYFNLEKNINKYYFAKLIVSLLIGIIINTIVLSILYFNLNIDLIIKLKLILLLIGCNIITIILQLVISMLVKTNIKAITTNFLLWFGLTIMNIIPIFHGFFCYFDNNSSINAYAANLLNIEIKQINDLNYVSGNIIFTYIIIVILLLLVIILINRRKKCIIR